MNEIKRITVIGSGAMGSQIAMVFALAGCEVHLQDVNEESWMNNRKMLERRLQRRVDKGKLSPSEFQQAFSRITFTASIEQAVKDSDFVIEAIVENLEAKRKLFETLDRIAPAHTILATNSSTIVSSKLADATQRPEQVCNMHFFNPALVMELVEVVQGPHTSNETARMAFDLAKRANKVPILLKKEISGFVANRILAKVQDEAFYLLENGIATVEEIDLACTKALNYPIGPFALLDLTGIDVHYNVRMQRYMESGDETQKPSRTVTEKYQRGEFGRKTGKGFYTYE